MVLAGGCLRQRRVERVLSERGEGRRQPGHVERRVGNAVGVELVGEALGEPFSRLVVCVAGPAENVERHPVEAELVGLVHVGPAGSVLGHLHGLLALGIGHQTLAGPFPHQLLPHRDADLLADEPAGRLTGAGFGHELLHLRVFDLVHRLFVGHPPGGHGFLADLLAGHPRRIGEARLVALGHDPGHHAGHAGGDGAVDRRVHLCDGNPVGRRRAQRLVGWTGGPGSAGDRGEQATAPRDVGRTAAWRHGGSNSWHVWHWPVRVPASAGVIGGRNSPRPAPSPCGRKPCEDRTANGTCATV